jgi:hypothetical protein
MRPLWHLSQIVFWGMSGTKLKPKKYRFRSALVWCSIFELKEKEEGKMEKKGAVLVPFLEYFSHFLKKGERGGGKGATS